MKKILFSLTAITSLSMLLTAADCLGSDSQVTACADDAECGDGEICSDEVCVTPDCEVDSDCQIQGSSSEVVVATEDCTCDDTCVVTFAGKFCAVAEEDGVFECEADLPGSSAVDAEVDGGGTASVCVDNTDTCGDGICAAAG